MMMMMMMMMMMVVVVVTKVWMGCDALRLDWVGYVEQVLVE